jgi:hypothetical protein
VELDIDLTRLRPIERRMVELARAGVAEVDIAQRFRRTPGYVRRVLALAEVPRQAVEQTVEKAIDDLRPVERVVLSWIDGGGRHADIAARLRRTPTYVLQVERLARRKLADLAEVAAAVVEPPTTDDQPAATQPAT